MAMRYASYRLGLVIGFAVALIVLAGTTRPLVAQTDLTGEELAERIEAKVRLLSSNDVRTRRDACKDLNDLCDIYKSRAKSCIPALIACLADEDSELAEAAMWGLANCGETALKPLIGCFSSENPLIRKHAVVAISNFAYTDRGLNIDQAIAPMGKLLKDTDAAVRQEAASILVRFRHVEQSTIEGLAAMLKSSIATDRTVALRAISALGFNEGEERLLPLKDSILQSVSDQDADVRVAAVGALWYSGLTPEELLRSLIRALDDPSVAVSGESISELRSLVRESDCSSAVPKLVQLLSVENENLGAVCRLLRDIGPKAKDAIPGLRKALQSSDIYVAASAAEGLWKIDRQVADSIPVLERFLERGDSTDGDRICLTICTLGPAAAPLKKYVIKLLKSGDSFVQSAAVDALGAIMPQDQEAIGLLTECLGNDSMHIVQSATVALGKIGAKAVPSLIEVTKTGSDIQREYAADALGQIGPPAKEAIVSLKNLLKSKHHPTKVWSAIAIGKINASAEVVPMLIEAVLEDESATARQQAAVALGKIGPKAKSAIPALRAALKEEDEALQQAAEEALGMIEGK